MNPVSFRWRGSLRCLSSIAGHLKAGILRRKVARTGMGTEVIADLRKFLTAITQGVQVLPSTSSTSRASDRASSAKRSVSCLPMPTMTAALERKAATSCALTRDS
jgi:hypothetical protein